MVRTYLITGIILNLTLNFLYERLIAAPVPLIKMLRLQPLWRRTQREGILEWPLPLV
jgi:hypothetical protein